MNPELELFDRLYYYSQNELNYNTYDQLPRPEANYPFIELAETENNSIDTKNAYSGAITQTINVWGDQDMRFKIAQIMDKFILNRIVSGHYIFNLTSYQKRILPDSSVPNTRLYHGVLTLVFDYMKGSK
ncbi:hypothetical protein [Lactobacillus intestinalis]|uniref:hypothetical protein n=1 Tax=Lactobacillus intestinalis TaxID=151781 RepID=UPI0026089707|nr:hypothetical protein [Lactobacillus intestinalis]